MGEPARDEPGKRKAEDDGEAAGDGKRRRARTEGGTLLFVGLTDYTRRNESEADKRPLTKWSPHRFSSLHRVKINLVSSHPTSYFFYAVSHSGGAVYSWGLNQRGQLGLGDTRSRRNPTLMAAAGGQEGRRVAVVGVATGRQHGLLLTEDGKVLACGDNTDGQCGTGSRKTPLYSLPTPVAYTGAAAAAVVQVACGDNFSMLVTSCGDVLSFGGSQYGQLGHGSDNLDISRRREEHTPEYAPRLLSVWREKDADSGEVTVLERRPHVVRVSCGNNHSCAIDADSRIFSWGFGGYGRLGHNSTTDEWTPRLMRCWYRLTGRADGGVTRAHCGAQFTFVETAVNAGCVYMFGQVKLTGNANMYPKYCDELNGLRVEHLACGMRGWSACCDHGQVYSVQVGPGGGLLALGEEVKSSTTPKAVTTLDGLHCFMTGYGYQHLCFLVRDAPALANIPEMRLPEHEGEEQDAKPSAKPPAKRGRGRPKKS